ncbi:hypothetical protein LH462_08670 [Laribacter hongkongensis]|nr:hypothetical protein [Laribacter hongkongensis]MCG9103791.1 hypothetical protein [Laribacter hongkongensis]MCG9113666.1 hypothetical protein [Laribacter hongkongensis]
MHETFSVPIARLVALHSQTDLKFFEVANCPESGWFGPARLPRCVPHNPHCALPLSVTRTIPFGITEPPFAFMVRDVKMPSIELMACSSKDGRIRLIHGVVFEMGHPARGVGLHTGFSRIYTPGQIRENPAFEHVVK